MSKKKVDVLLVVDMQNDFIDGVLDNPAAAAIVPEVVKEIREWNGKVIATRDTHFEDSFKDSVEGKRLPIHCVFGTEGWKIQNDVQMLCRCFLCFGRGRFFRFFVPAAAAGNHEDRRQQRQYAQ